MSTLKLEETRKNSEKLIDTLKAVSEETDIRIADLKKEAYEFKRDIVVGAENIRTGNTIAEKVSELEVCYFLPPRLPNGKKLVEIIGIFLSVEIN